MHIRDIYHVSLCRNGVLGGLLYLKDAEMIYCTNKLTVPDNIRRLHMPYSEILDIRKTSSHTVMVSMKDGETYRFLVFSRESFLRNSHAKMQRQA